MEPRKRVVRHAPQRAAGSIKVTDVYFRRGTSVYGAKQRMKKLLETHKEVNVYALGAAVKPALAAVALLRRDNARVVARTAKESVAVVDEVFDGADASVPRAVERKSRGVHVVLSAEPVK